MTEIKTAPWSVEDGLLSRQAKLHRRAQRAEGGLAKLTQWLSARHQAHAGDDGVPQVADAYLASYGRAVDVLNDHDINTMSTTLMSELDTVTKERDAARLELAQGRDRLEQELARLDSLTAKKDENFGRTIADKDRQIDRVRDDLRFANLLKLTLVKLDDEDEDGYAIPIKLDEIGARLAIEGVSKNIAEVTEWLMAGGAVEIDGHDFVLVLGGGDLARQIALQRSGRVVSDGAVDAYAARCMDVLNTLGRLLGHNGPSLDAVVSAKPEKMNEVLGDLKGSVELAKGACAAVGEGFGTSEAHVAQVVGKLRGLVSEPMARGARLGRALAAIAIHQGADDQHLEYYAKSLEGILERMKADGVRLQRSRVLCDEGVGGIFENILEAVTATAVGSLTEQEAAEHFGKAALVAVEAERKRGAEVGETPGYVWTTCTVRCMRCAHIHVAVQEMPEWAAVPASCECPRCHAPNSCLPMAEPPEKVDQEPIEEWPDLSVIAGGWRHDAPADVAVGDELFAHGEWGIVRRSRPFKLHDIGAGWAKVLAQDIAEDASEFAAQSKNLYGDWDNPPKMLDGAEDELRELVSSWTRRFLRFDLIEVEVHAP